MPIAPRICVALCLALGLGACSSDPKDEISDKLAQQMKQAGRGASDAEREQVADALATDVVEFGAEARAGAAEQERAARDIEARYGTPGQAISEECRSLQTTVERLEAIQSDSTGDGRYTAEELAALPGELDRTRARLRELCDG